MAWKGPTKQPKVSPPNDVSNDQSVANGDISVKREEQIRRDSDSFKNYKIGLIDIDTTIFEHLQNYIKPQIVENGEVVQVPIIMSNPERWVSAQKDGYIRDQNGKIMRPMIIINRSSISNFEPLTMNRILSCQFEQKYSTKNRYDRCNTINKQLEPPTKEVYNIVMPDKVTITYECVAWTNKIAQMNNIIEKINFATHDYWGTKQNRFRTEINDYNNQTELNVDQERIVKTTFQITVHGRLVPEFFEDGSSTTIKRLTPRKLVLGEELKTSKLDFPKTQTSQNNLDIRFVDPNKNRKNVTNNI